jgi:4-hydroxy-tetrahydrodipicolinate synthase
MRQIIELAHAGDLDGAKAQDAALYDLYTALAVTTNPIPVKAALNLLGHDVGGLRLPLVEADADETATVAAALEAAGIRSAANV